MYTRFVLVLLLTGTFFITHAQDAALNKKARKAYEKAQASIRHKQYPEAIQALYITVQEAPDFAEAYQVLGDLFRISEDYENAVINYRKVTGLDPGFSEQTWYGLGISLFNLAEYTEAGESFRRYLQHNREGTQAGEAAQLIAHCEFAAKAVKEPVPYTPVKLDASVNTADDEYLPALTVDGHMLVFTRKGPQREDIYVSYRDAGKWTPASSLSSSINSPFNEGSESISPDGQTLYFTSCSRPGGRGGCDIYYAVKRGEAWSRPVNLGEPVNSRAWESQPSISPDGKTLYFASDRPGTLGGIDIWKTVRREDGSWSQPENLGPEINTPYEEQVPFIHPDNQTLYFTSEGWPGMGGKDIFYSRRNSTGAWQKAVNMGYPVNTVNDESSLMVSADGFTGYFAQKDPRAGSGYDLYTFEIPEETRPVPVSYVSGKIIDKENKQPLSAGVEVINIQTGETVFRSGSNAATGRFVASLPAKNKYLFNVSRRGYLFYSGHFNLKDHPADDPFRLDIALAPIRKDEKVVLENIFFETDSSRLLPESYPELDKVIAFLKANPGVSIEISGHTDSTGTPGHNLTLSENRARSVYAYLVRGILQPERFQTKGYGETQPVASNETEAGRAQNRRTELKIIGN